MFSNRNKCEYTFGIDKAGQPSIGFRISSFRDGVIVDSPNLCPNVPNAMKLVAVEFDSFVKSSPLQCYDISSHLGASFRIITWL